MTQSPKKHVVECVPVVKQCMIVFKKGPSGCCVGMHCGGVRMEAQRSSKW